MTTQLQLIPNVTRTDGRAHQGLRVHRRGRGTAAAGDRQDRRVDRQDLDAIGGTRAHVRAEDFKWLRRSALQAEQPQVVLAAVPRGVITRLEKVANRHGIGRSA